MDQIRAILRKPLFPGLVLIAIILLITAPRYASTYTIILLATICMHSVLSLSWAVFSGPTGYISLASAAFFGVGIYTSAILGNQFPLVVLVLIAGLASFLVALIVGALTLRLRGIYFSMFTFGLVALIKNLLLWWEMTVTRTRGRFVVIVDHVTVYYYMLTILALALLAAYLIRRSRFGLALRSIGDDEEAAAHAGVNINLLKTFTFAISAVFMGAAGAVMATRWTYIDPYIAFNVLFSFMPVLMAIFGGVGQLLGPILGAAVFAYLEELLITRFPYYYMLLFGVILIVAVLYLPRGLIGLLQRWRRKGLGGQR